MSSVTPMLKSDVKANAHTYVTQVHNKIGICLSVWTGVFYTGEVNTGNERRTGGLLIEKLTGL